MNQRYFWLLSDGKTVREISWDQFQEIVGKGALHKSRTYQLCAISNNEISFHKGNKYSWVRRSQLDQVLEACKHE